MDGNKQQTIKVLNGLIQLCKSSEEGFRVTAASVKNRGLKSLLKAYARQRRQFAEELQAAVRELGGEPRQSGGFLGGVHRGWIIIKAALTIGPENTEKVVLAEAERGESYALRQYDSALQKALPAELHTLAERQYEQVKEAAAQVSQMRGSADGRLVVRLFDGDEDVQRAQEALQEAGFSEETIRTMEFDTADSQYESNGKQSTVLETVSAGGLGGAIFGAVLGVIAGIATRVISGPELMFANSMAGTIAVTLLSGLLVGALFGAIFGVLIGLGVSEQDTYLYDSSVRHGKVLMMVHTDNNARASEASTIMQRVNLSRAQQ